MLSKHASQVVTRACTGGRIGVVSIPIRHFSSKSSNNYNHAALSTNLHQSPTRNTIIRLLSNIGSKKEVEQYLKFYNSLDTPKFAVIKVGGGILLEEMDTLVSSLSFLSDVGLFPVVLHGNGPQLNDELKSLGIVSDYIGGMRITTPEILRVAREVSYRENLRLVKALEDHGTRARPIPSGVFEAEFLDRDKYGLVGQTTRVNTAPVYQCLESGQIPILTCMGETVYGQTLNINADVAGQELAKAMKPVKIVYLSSNGGLRDEHDKVMNTIDLDTDYETLMTQPWFKHGNRLKLKEIKTLLDQLPLSSSVAITSAANLPKELFTHKGSGTLVRRSEKIIAYASLDEIDTDRLRHLIEQSFGGRLIPNYLDSIKSNIHRIFLSEHYRAVAIVTKDRSDPNSIPYLDKFAVTKLSQSEGTGHLLWQALYREIPKMYWRSRSTNVINSFYFDRAQGTFTNNEWHVFWYGLKDLIEAQKCVDKSLNHPPTIDRSQPVQVEEYDASKSSASFHPTRGFSTSTSRFSHSSCFSHGSSLFRSSLRPYTRSSSSIRYMSTSTKNTKQTRIGLIGARGHTGNELIKLIDNHPHLTITVASSRQLKGQPMSSVVPDLKTNSLFRDLKFIDLSANDLPSVNNVDVWILALPNNLAKPFVTALDQSKSSAKVIDLSADYRFDPTWQYGLPERHNFRSLISSHTRIANPGCYATGMQCTLLPVAHLLDHLQVPQVFGVSGYSGAGTTPSRKNDMNELRDNLMPYTLIGHMHEKEVSTQLKGSIPTGIRFMPHVAPWFRGISLTIGLQLKGATTREQLLNTYRDYFNNEPLVHITPDIPEVRSCVGQHHVTIGGFIHDPSTHRLVMTTTLDNLLKGAATQCIQNINLMQGYHETDGIPLSVNK